MPLLHIKLESMKNFVKAIVKHRLNGFAFDCKKFPKLIQIKLKEGIFVGPQIWRVFEDIEFKKALIHWNYKLGMNLSGFDQFSGKF